MTEWDIRNELFGVCVLALKVRIPACKRLYEFNMRLVKQHSKSTAGKTRNISSWMSTRLQITQSYKHNRGKKSKNKQCSCSTKKKKKEEEKFSREHPWGLFFMWNDSGPPLLSCRDTKGSKTPKAHFLKVHKQTPFWKVWSGGSGSTLSCLFECADRSLQSVATIYSQLRPVLAAAEAELKQFISMLLRLAAFCLPLLYLM